MSLHGKSYLDNTYFDPDGQKQKEQQDCMLTKPEVCALTVAINEISHDSADEPSHGRL